MISFEFVIRLEGRRHVVEKFVFYEVFCLAFSRTLKSFLSDVVYVRQIEEFVKSQK